MTRDPRPEATLHRLVATLRGEPQREPARIPGRFDGLKLRVPPPQPVPEPELAPAPKPDLAAAVERHGRIVQTLRFHRRVGVSVTADQRAELAASRASLKAFYPSAVQDLEQAMAADTRLIGEAAKGRTAATIRAMQLEAEMRESPTLRADVFVQRWQALERQRRLLMRDHENSRAGKVADTMVGMAKGLERDPQVESILRNRKVQLGLSANSGPRIGAALGEMIGRGRSRGLSIGM